MSAVSKLIMERPVFKMSADSSTTVSMDGDMKNWDLIIVDYGWNAAQ